MAKTKLHLVQMIQEDPDTVHEFHDRRLIVYKRDNSRFWQMRARIPGDKNYRFKSLKTTDVHRACTEANDQYQEWIWEKKRGLDSRPKLMSAVINEFLKDLKERLRTKLTTIHMETLYRGRCETYITPFFGNMPIASIDQKAMEKYYRWRMQQGKKPPAKQTLNIEKTTLGVIFQFAQDKKYYPSGEYPKLEIPDKVDGDDGENRRPAFTRDEWDKFPDLLDDWIERATTGDHTYLRQMLKGYVLLMGCTGMRTNDVHDLKWAALQKLHHANEHWGQVNKLHGTVSDHIVKIEVTGKGMNRSLFGSPEAVGILIEWRCKCKWIEDDDLVFCSERRKQYSFTSPFRTFLKEYDLLLDRNGEPRTPYSLRHTYATLKLESGVNMHILAKQMGTSEQMLRQHYSHVELLDNIDQIYPDSPSSKRTPRS
ncbi:MAG: tyrosine-type recombinase/integrase [Rhodospirillaceae bacterium]